LIPAAFLGLSLKDVLTLQARREPGAPASVADITRALASLDAQRAAIAADRAAKDRQWLAERIGSLATELPE
jgi:hypothetical protein